MDKTIEVWTVRGYGADGQLLSTTEVQYNKRTGDTEKIKTIHEESEAERALRKEKIGSRLGVS